jgi:hypothetical protein
MPVYISLVGPVLLVAEETIFVDPLDPVTIKSSSVGELRTMLLPDPLRPDPWTGKDLCISVRVIGRDGGPLSSF